MDYTHPLINVTKKKCYVLFLPRYKKIVLMYVNDAIFDVLYKGKTGDRTVCYASIDVKILENKGYGPRWLYWPTLSH